MTKLKKALQYILVGIVAIPAIAYYFLFYIYRYAKNPQKYSFEKRYEKIRKMARIVLRAYFCRYKITGLEEFNKRKGTEMIVINHLSDIDPLCLITLSDRPMTFVAKQEAMSFPFVGKVLTALEAFSLDRDNVVSQFNTIKAIVSHLKDPNKPPVAVYIEGTRNKNPETHCLDFHPGTLKIAAMAGVPVTPIANYGTFRILTLKSYLHHYPVFFDFQKQISAEEVKSYDLNEFAVTLKKQVDDKVDEFRKLDQEFVYKQWLTKHRKALETIPDTCVKS